MFFVLGLVILLMGGQGLVRGAVGLARALGVSSLVIGLTVVSFGTSSPELAVCLRSATGGIDDVAVANAVGSNIANVLLILGVSAAMRTIPVAPRLASVVTPLMVLCTLVLFGFSWDLRITRVESAALVAGLGGYLWLSYRMSRSAGDGMAAEGHVGDEEESTADPSAEDPVDPALTTAAEHKLSESLDDTPAALPQKRYVLNALLVIVGLVLLVWGSDMMVNAAVTIAGAVGLSEVVIGLTIVAIGTSLPELATTIVAVYRDEPDIAAGNVVGSNIFNILAIVGITGLVSPLTMSNALVVRDMPISIASAAVLVPWFLTRQRISRIEGTVLLVAYFVYLGWLAVSGG